jgi:hypothetical protein
VLTVEVTFQGLGKDGPEVNLLAESRKPVQVAELVTCISASLGTSARQVPEGVVVTMPLAGSYGGDGLE